MSFSPHMRAVAPHIIRSRARLFSTSPDPFAALHPALQTALASLSITAPTPIQTSSLHHFANTPPSDHLIIGSETGSGKTLAYLLPLIDTLLKKPTSLLGHPERTTSIIVCPNKELVQQILFNAASLSPNPEKCLIYGASPSTVELFPLTPPSSDPPLFTIAALPGGLRDTTDFPPWRNPELAPDIVVTTPSSFSSLALDINNLPLMSRIETLVVDECDMVLDGGYLRDLKNILTGFKRKTKTRFEDVPPSRHVFVGATIPSYGLRSVEAFILRNFPDATRLNNNLHRARHEGLTTVDWRHAETDGERFVALQELLQKEGDNSKIMVFANTVDAVDLTVEALRAQGVDNVLSYHAKMNSEERVGNLNAFRAHENREVLVCTDLASRGLDIPDVSLVIQLQFAANVVAHLHRVGRCGRLTSEGRSGGRAVVFWGEQERDLVEAVRQVDVIASELMGVAEDEEGGTVEAAFSRKRGFRKKRKKEARGNHN